MSHGYYFVHKGEELKISSNQKKVYQYDLDNNFIKEYDSARKAAKELGFKSSSGIVNCCNGKSKTSHGYIWRHEKYDINERINSTT